MNKQQLATKIWESANRMRSKIEPNEYKDYILGFIFYKYLSDKEEQWLLSQEYTEEDIINYVNEADRDTFSRVQGSLGYFISYKDLFSTWIRLGSDFSVDNVRTALSSFSRLISPSHKKVFEGIFNTLRRDFPNWATIHSLKLNLFVTWFILLMRSLCRKNRIMMYWVLFTNS
mgnify:CR=1 FL=1